MRLHERDFARFTGPEPAERYARTRVRVVRFVVHLAWLRGYSLSMPAKRKLDEAALDEIVAGHAAGRSVRQIAAALEVAHSTLSRRIRSDPELRARIGAVQKREARRARDRERKARAKARRGAGVEPSSRPEREQSPFARPAGGVEREMWDRAMRVAQSRDRVPEHLPTRRVHDGEQRDPPPSAAQSETTGVPRFSHPASAQLGSGGVLLFPHTPEGQAERLAYHEDRRLADPPYSIWDSNAVRRGELTVAERKHLRRTRR